MPSFTFLFLIGFSFSFLLVKEAVGIQLYERLYAFIIRFLFNPTVMTGAKLFCDCFVFVNMTNETKIHNDVRYVTIL